MVDQLFKMVTALSSELTMTRERLDTVERLAEQGGALSRPAIDAYRADGDAAAEREALRQRHIRKVFRPMIDRMVQNERPTPALDVEAGAGAQS